MSKSVVIKGGTVINRNSQEVADVKIENDCVTEVGKNLKGDIQLDASGCIVSSGFVDLHAHLREPGKEEAETIETGSRAGALGGYTALAFAAKYPERLAGLSLVHSHPFADTEEQKANRRRGIELLQNGKKEAYVSQLVPGLFPESFRKILPEFVQTQLEQARRQSAEGIARALQGMIDRADHSALLSELTVPVQFVVGELDTLVPPALLLPLLAKPIVSDVQWLSDCGHMGLIENPQRVAEALTQFHGLCTLMAQPQKA
jgi:fermentation-respiration switch protein FrsA (DUF1100 family)